MKKKFLFACFVLLAILFFVSLQKPKVEENPPVQTPTVVETVGIQETDEYDTKDEVALYIHTFNHLPNNYMTKSEARKKGWEGGALHLVVPGKAIGGDVFSNFEGDLPEKRGRTYYECDIDTMTKEKRGAKRIVFSNDGLIYYTSNHYDSFELLYGDEGQ